MWPYVFRYPGLVVLHDGQLHFTRARLLLQQKRYSDYRAEFKFNHPEARPGLADLEISGLLGSLHYFWPTANAACDFPNAIRHSRSVRGSTTSHHAIAAGRRKARGWCLPYFSQPILEGDRSLFSPVPSPLVPRQWAQSANSLGKWRARQDSNLRPSA